MQRLKNLLVVSRSLHKNGPFISHHYSRTISAQPNYYAQHHNYQEDQASLSSLSLKLCTFLCVCKPKNHLYEYFFRFQLKGELIQEQPYSIDPLHSMLSQLLWFVSFPQILYSNVCGFCQFCAFCLWVLFIIYLLYVGFVNSLSFVLGFCQSQAFCWWVLFIHYNFGIIVVQLQATRLERLYESWEENPDIGFVLMKVTRYPECFF